jgi:hypothetical protein
MTIFEKIKAGNGGRPYNIEAILCAMCGKNGECAEADRPPDDTGGKNSVYAPVRCEAAK